MKTILSLAALCLLGVQATNLESEKRWWTGGGAKKADGVTKSTCGAAKGGGKAAIGGHKKPVTVVVQKGNFWAQTEAEAEANTDAKYCGDGGCGLGYGDWGFGGYNLGGWGGYGGYGSYGGLGGCGLGASCWAETESETQVLVEA